MKVTFDFYCKELEGLKLVVTTVNEEKTLTYQSYALSDFYNGNEKKQKGMFYFVLPPFYNANDILSVYIWNPAKKVILYDNFRVAVYSNQ